MSSEARGYSLVPRPSDAVHGMVSPVVRLLYWYSHGTRPGTGFFLGAWHRTIVTAAHVVRLNAGESPKRLRVQIMTADLSAVFTVHATAFAYPEPFHPSTDLAVIRLPFEVPEVQPDLRGWKAPASAFDAAVYGYRTGCKKLRRSNVRVAGAAPWLRYVNGTGLPGMSGGPVADGDRVFGVHMGSFDLNGTLSDGAWALQQGWLDACLAAAREASSE